MIPNRDELIKSVLSPISDKVSLEAGFSPRKSEELGPYVWMRYYGPFKVSDVSESAEKREKTSFIMALTRP